MSIRRRLRLISGNIFNYIDAHHPPGALKVKKAIRDTTLLLEHFPYIGVKTDHSAVRMLGVARYPYLVFYTIAEERGEIFILNVRHSARQR